MDANRHNAFIYAWRMGALLFTLYQSCTIRSLTTQHIVEPLEVGELARHPAPPRIRTDHERNTCAAPRLKRAKKGERHGTLKVKFMRLGRVECMHRIGNSALSTISTVDCFPLPAPKFVREQPRVGTYTRLCL